MDEPNLYKEAFERFPLGVIFSKLAPTAQELGAESLTGFTYYYFSPGIETRSSLQRIVMCNGDVTAQRDFPMDYEQYFRDDMDVIKLFRNGNIKSFCEPWSPSGVKGDVHFVSTFKTAFSCKSDDFMLGCFEMIDDLITGQVTSKTVPYDATSSLPPVAAYEISDDWFEAAFAALPMGMLITDCSNRVVASNSYWRSLLPDCVPGAVCVPGCCIPADANASSCLTSAKWQQAAPKIPFSVPHLAGQYGIVLGGGQDLEEEYHVFVLRPDMKSVSVPYYSDGVLVKR